jgi:NifB/MoaA-like Fe-S oxidoreductase
MGGGCRNIFDRETIYAGGKCENHCFSHHGGCNASDALAIKQQETCEYKTSSHEVLLMSMNEINEKIDKFTQRGKSIFLYTPDMFSDLYFETLFKKLPSRNGNTYIAINAGARTLTDHIEDMELIREKGIHEIWIGVESADPEIRKRYCKPDFTNEEIIELTTKAKRLGINICWYLVDGKEDSESTRLATYNLIREGNPFRINIEQLQ